MPNCSKNNPEKFSIDSYDCSMLPSHAHAACIGMYHGSRSVIIITPYPSAPVSVRSKTPNMAWTLLLL